MRNLQELGLYELVTNHPPMPVESLLSKLANKHTRRTYQRAFKDFFIWLERDPVVATTSLLDDYKGELLAKYPPAVVAIRLAAIQQLYQEALEQGLIRANPAAAVRLPNVTPEPGYVAPSRRVAAQRLGHCRRNLQSGQRDYALYVLLVDTEVQPEEVSGLRVGDYQGDRGEEILWLRQGKHSQPVRLHLSRHVVSALDAYLERREVADDSPLFESFRSRDFTA